MLFPVVEVEKSGYVLVLLSDEDNENTYWLRLSYEKEEILFTIKIKREEEEEELINELEQITTTTLDKLLDLRKVKGFSAGRLLRYVRAGKRMDQWFKIFSASIVATIAIEVFLYIIYRDQEQWLLLGTCLGIGIVISTFCFLQYRKHRKDLRYDR